MLIPTQCCKQSKSLSENQEKALETKPSCEVRPEIAGVGEGGKYGQKKELSWQRKIKVESKDGRNSK